MNIDKKTAKTQFTIEKHRDSYEIKEFANVCFRVGSPSKGSGYEYYFGSDRTPREITIPDQIDGLPVTKIAVKCLPGDAIVFCRADLYPKLTRETKASTARAFLEEPARFEAEEADQIKAFVKKYSEDVAHALCGSDCAEAYVRFLELAKTKPEMLEKLADSAEGNAEIKALLLNKSSGKKAEDLTFEPKKMTVTEFKKLWTYSEYPSKETGEKLIRLSNYKGTDEHVVIPFALGKKQITQIEGMFPATVTSVEFENPDIEIRCSFRNCKAMADENGFIIVHAPGRSILTDYIGERELEILRIPDGVTENTYGTFHGLKVKKVILPPGFKKLAGGTFSDCIDLQSAELPEGLEEIGQLAFGDCRSLKRLYIPASVNIVGLFDFRKNAEIYGEPGTAAQSYAVEHGIPFHEGQIPEEV